MEEILTFLLGNTVFRTFIEGIAVKIVAEILHRRSVDKDFLEKSDAAFTQLQNAQTDEEKISAHLAIQSLMSS